MPTPLEVPPRIAILGPGAIGCLLAAQLSAAGHPVVLWGRDARSLERIAREGVHVRGLLELDQRVETASGPLPRADLYLVTVKTTANRDMSERMAIETPPDSTVVVMQNGLDPEADFQARLGNERVVRAVMYLGARRESPGCVDFTFYNRPTVLGGDAARATGVARLLSRAGHAAEAVLDLRPRAWEKVILNAITNPLCALGGRTIAEVMADPRFERLLEEAIAVARADGMDPGPDFVARAHAATRQAGAHRGSMWADMQAGAPIEIEQLNGRIIALGARLGVPTPTHREVVAELSAFGGKSEQAG